MKNWKTIVLVVLILVLIFLVFRRQRSTYLPPIGVERPSFAPVYATSNVTTCNSYCRSDCKGFIVDTSNTHPACYLVIPWRNQNVPASNASSTFQYYDAGRTVVSSISAALQPFTSNVFNASLWQAPIPSTIYNKYTGQYVLPTPVTPLNLDICSNMCLASSTCKAFAIRGAAGTLSPACQLFNQDKVNLGTKSDANFTLYNKKI